MADNGGYAKPETLVTTDWVAEHVDDPRRRPRRGQRGPVVVRRRPHARCDRAALEGRAAAAGRARRDRPGRVRAPARLEGHRERHDGRALRRQERQVRGVRLRYLKLYGHEDVRIMDGGRQKWIDEDRPLTTDPLERAEDVPREDAGITRSAAWRDDILAILDLAERRRGLDVLRAHPPLRRPQGVPGELIAMPGYQQEGAQRGGHVPGAASIPWAQAVREDGTFKRRRGAARPVQREGRRRKQADHRVLPDRRALEPQLVRPARAARPPGTSATTTARGPSGATWLTCRSRRAPEAGSANAARPTPGASRTNRAMPRRCHSVRREQDVRSITRW